MLRCTHCKTENPDDARLCRECGKVLTARDFATGVAPLPPGAQPPDSAPAGPGSAAGDSGVATARAEAAPGVLACSYCGQEVTSDAQFCPRCGKSVAAPGMLACPHCGQEVTSDAEFCPKCGKSVYVEYASFGRRLGGYLIDYVILLVLALVPASIVAAIIIASAPDVAFTPEQVQQQEDAELNASLASGGISFVIGFAYVVVLNATGGTWGKRALGMRLERDDNGENIGVVRAVVRYFVAIASGIALLLGYLWCIWDDKKQTWHDKAAGSVVVRT